MTEVEQQAPAPTTEAPAKEEVVEEKKVEAEAENKEEEKKDEEKKEDSEKDEKVLEFESLLHTFLFFNNISKFQLFIIQIDFMYFKGQERKERKGQKGKGAKRTCSSTTTSSTQEGFRKGHCLFVPISSLPKATQHFSKMSQSRNLVEAPWNQI